MHQSPQGAVGRESARSAAEILLISKPVVPPWNDSSKNLVRDLAASMRVHRPIVLTARGHDPGLAGVGREPLFPRRSGRFAPALRDNARVLARLLAGPRRDLWHFFFAPNPRSAKAGRLAVTARRVPSVQTVCSAPRPEQRADDILFADRTVVLSKHTRDALIERGAVPSRLRCIPPGILPIAAPSDADRARERALHGDGDSPLIVYPGDLEFSAGAERSLEVLAELPASLDTRLVMACRRKTPKAAEQERRLHDRARALGIPHRVAWVGETTRIHTLLAAADLVLLPSETLYAKMDLPMVLLEAMSLRRPVIVLEGTAAAELAEGDAARAVPAQIDALASEARRVLEDVQHARALGERAAKAVRERYDVSRMAAAYEELYQELLDGA